MAGGRTGGRFPSRALNTSTRDQISFPGTTKYDMHGKVRRIVLWYRFVKMGVSLREREREKKEVEEAMLFLADRCGCGPSRTRSS